MPISGIFGYRILPSGKIRARKAQSKKSLLDFFDKLTGRPAKTERPASFVCMEGGPQAANPRSQAMWRL